jgi:hypothetical protein
MKGEEVFSLPIVDPHEGDTPELQLSIRLPLRPRFTLLCYKANKLATY